MRLAQYQVDAFTGRVFAGNPAAVVPLAAWPDDAVLQAIADENNLSETAFLVPTERGFALRWFTPATEVDLCGHATLAAAHVLFERRGFAGDVVTFETRSGDLHVRRRGDRLAMDFPARPPLPCEAPEELLRGLGVRPREVLAADDYLVVLDSEAAVRDVVPDQAALARLDRRGVIVTAPGTDVDFVSRFFAPRVGVPEDPVTGSAHCELAPYWGARLGKSVLRARQVSRRGGEIGCELSGDRVVLLGSAVTFMEGEIEADAAGMEAPHRSLLVSYLTLRKAIGGIGIALPFALAAAGFLLFGEGIQPSISAYYHTGVGDLLVGGLCAIGVFLLSYKGPEPRDGIAGNLACAFAVGTAIFPTSRPGATSAAAQAVGAVHWTCAALFLGTLACFSLFLFTKTHQDPARRPTPRKLQRNKVYRVCGWAMVACLVLILGCKLLPDGPKAALAPYSPVYWLEAAAIVAFGVSWLVKGEAILKDEFASVPGAEGRGAAHGNP